LGATAHDVQQGTQAAVCRHLSGIEGRRVTLSAGVYDFGCYEGTQRLWQLAAGVELVGAPGVVLAGEQARLHVRTPGVTLRGLSFPRVHPYKDPPSCVCVDSLCNPLSWS